MTRTALVTGASSGIGQATAQALLNRGYRVIGTARKPESMPSESRLESVEYLSLDLADDFTTVLNHLDNNERAGISPQKVAETIVKAVTDDPPKPLYAVGSNAPLVFAARRLMPRTLAEKVMARKFGLSR